MYNIIYYTTVCRTRPLKCHHEMRPGCTRQVLEPPEEQLLRLLGQREHGSCEPLQGDVEAGEERGAMLRQQQRVPHRGGDVQRHATPHGAPTCFNSFYMPRPD